MYFFYISESCAEFILRNRLSASLPLYVCVPVYLCMCVVGVVFGCVLCLLLCYYLISIRALKLPADFKITTRISVYFVRHSQGRRAGGGLTNDSN